MYPCDWFYGSYLCQHAENSWKVFDLGPLKRNLRKQTKESESHRQFSTNKFLIPVLENNLVSRSVLVSRCIVFRAS